MADKRDGKQYPKVQKNTPVNRTKKPVRIRYKKPARKFTMENRKKLMVVFWVLVAAIGALIVRLNYINMDKGADYSKRVLSQLHYDSQTLPFRRGDITDRNGAAVATSEKVYNLVIDSYVITNSKVKTAGDCIEPTLDALKTYFDLDKEEMRDYINAHPENRYYVVKKQLKYEVVDPYNKLMASEEKEDEEKARYIKGIWFEEEYIRKYPYSTLASDVIGFTYSGDIGAYGLEAYYNDSLNGTNGREYGYMAEGTGLERTTIPAINGNNVVSTIDMNIQRIIERHIYEYNQAIGSKNTGVIVQDVKTGEILAMASYPNFNLNNPRDLSRYYTEEELDAMSDEEKLEISQGIWRNFCVSDTYEQGSTGKIITIAAALEENLVDPSDTYVCTGSKKVDVETIECNAKHGTVDLSGAIEYSCNVALMDIGFELGAERFTKYQNLFGYGQKTNIDLPAEEGAAGLVRSADQLNIVDLATESFGQNYNTNMVQVISAFSSIVNGGSYYKPHIVKEITSSTGNTVQTFDKELVRTTVSKKTADWLKESLYQTVERGTGKHTKIDGYKIGGKTSTAEKLPRNSGKCLVAFLSAAPIDDPQIALYVVIDEPKTTRQGDSTLPQVLSRKIYEEILPYLQIFPENADSDSQTDTADTTDTTADTQPSDNTQDSVADSTDESDSTAESDAAGPDVTQDDENTEETGLTETQKRILWSEYLYNNAVAE